MFVKKTPKLHNIQIDVSLTDEQSSNSHSFLCDLDQTKRDESLPASEFV